MHIKRTDAGNQDFVGLVKLLDSYLAEKDGEEHSFYDQFNNIDSLKNVIIIYHNELPIACGAIKDLAPGTMEVKRMYTRPAYRGKGIATKILAELEKWALELSNETCVLETGLKQVEAIGLYKKNHYVQIENYGQYAGVKNSLCFEKKIG